MPVIMYVPSVPSEVTKKALLYSAQCRQPTYGELQEPIRSLSMMFSDPSWNDLAMPLQTWGYAHSLTIITPRSYVKLNTHHESDTYEPLETPKRYWWWDLDKNEIECMTGENGHYHDYYMHMPKNNAIIETHRTEETHVHDETQVSFRCPRVYLRSDCVAKYLKLDCLNPPPQLPPEILADWCEDRITAKLQPQLDALRALIASKGELP